MPHVRLHRSLAPETIAELVALGLLREGQPLDWRRDAVLVSSGLSNQPLGCLIVRPALYAHSLAFVPGSTISRLHADALFYFANGMAATRDIGTTLFHVAQSNGRMHEWAKAKGAVAEPDSLYYRYDI